MSLMEIQNLTKEFTVRKSLTKGDIVKALDEVSLELREKELLGIVGASGSGKSTLARLLVLLYRPTSGKIIFNNEDVSHHKGQRLKVYRKNIQMVFQDPYASLDPFHNVEWHIKRPLLINHYKGNVSDRVQELLTQVKLDPPSQFLDKYPHQMSGGQRQRVYMARALATEPKVLIADEPVSMLDVSLRIEILELLLSLRENLGISIIYITHDLNTVSMITDRIYVLNKGKVVESGNTKQVIENPVDEYTRRLIKAAPDPYKKIEVD
ncbi:MAG: ATP-binding cassette domain-containing protein [Thermoplasmatales archaeon]|nr:ATP-binding cassette domain-containing protein [Cuniculiplasma sp.]WMT49059.1 MAG: ATP-binding cassette domain-containing protein [Thermoplasmatales archaeon]